MEEVMDYLSIIITSFENQQQVLGDHPIIELGRAEAVDAYIRVQNINTCKCD